MKFAMRFWSASIAVLMGLAVGQARATNHALIMWIGAYSDPRASLPGIDKDAANARKIAAAMGVSSAHITEISNSALTPLGIGSELKKLTARIQEGDHVFLYYSGHGAQYANSTGQGGARCTEALYTYDSGVFPDSELEDALKVLGKKAGQLIFMNDSCFSGGAASRTASRALGVRGGAVPKFFSVSKQEPSGVAASMECGDPVNKPPLSRNLVAVATIPEPPRMIYLAAAAANEVAMATADGSIATQAWANCVGADHNGSGGVSASELKACAQEFVDHAGMRQTITAQGDLNAPIIFMADQPAVQPTSVNAANALQDIAALAHGSYVVKLWSDRRQLKIGTDFLDLSLETNKDGYLYLLHVGSDGKTFNVLFPNQFDGKNHLKPGRYTFPRDAWRVMSGGPAGRSHLLALLTPTPMTLGKDMDLTEVFPSAKVTAETMRQLIPDLEPAGGGKSGRRFGASTVLSIDEVQ